jgi:hypothetical protein
MASIMSPWVLQYTCQSKFGLKIWAFHMIPPLMFRITVIGSSPSHQPIKCPATTVPLATPIMKILGHIRPIETLSHQCTHSGCASAARHAFACFQHLVYALIIGDIWGMRLTLQYRGALTRPLAAAHVWCSALLRIFGGW